VAGAVVATEKTLVVDANKACRRCGEMKKLSEFPRIPKCKDGLSPRCRTCFAEARRGYRKRNPERHKELQRAWYKKNKEKHRAYNLQKLYGITIEEYEAMVIAQGGVCALCRKPPYGRRNGSKLHIDHDHKTGRIRGLLCYHCNNGLGRFTDDPDLLRRAADYIEAVD
jgi:hypothetical protein